MNNIYLTAVFRQARSINTLLEYSSLNDLELEDLL